MEIAADKTSVDGSGQHHITSDYPHGRNPEQDRSREGGTEKVTGPERKGQAGRSPGIAKEKQGSEKM